MEIVRQVARHRFLRSTHVATLVGRSLDRTNDRLSKLYHAGYVDRPRAQLDYHPTGGSDFFVYALANRGARLLIEHDGIENANVDWSRKNREAGRPFIEHQLEVVDFRVALVAAVRSRPEVRLILPEEIVATSPEATRRMRNPFAMRTIFTYKGVRHDIGLVPDFAFSLELGKGVRRNFLVEIDRGTMPVVRRDFSQTSFERKMRCYQAAYAARKPDRQFRWTGFRILTVTTNERRTQSMLEALRHMRVYSNVDLSLFLFATKKSIAAGGLLTLL